MTHSVAKKIWEHLSPLRRREFVRQCFLLGMSTVMENLSVVALSVFATTLLSPAGIATSWWYPYLKGAVPSIAGSQAQVLLLTGGIAVALVLGKSFVGAVASAAQAAFATNVEIDLGEKLLTSLTKVNVAWFHTKNTSDLTLVANWRQYSFNYLNGIMQIILNSALCGALLAVLMYTSPVMSITIIVVCGPVGTLLFSIFKHRMHSAAKIYGNCCAAINDLFFCLIQGAKETRIFNAYPLIRGQFVREGEKSVQARRKQYLFTYLPSACFELVTLAILVLITSLLASGAVGSMSAYEITEKITMLGATAWRLMPAINRLVDGLSALKATQHFLEKYFSLLDDAKTREVEVDSSSESPAIHFNDKIIFDNVCFSYEAHQPPVIHDVNVTFHRGESIGIIGESGAGKSTFANLLLGLYSPTSGTISIDGHVLTEREVPSWLSGLGYVPQDPFLRNASLAENIAYGLPFHLIDLERVIECCRIAAIDFFPLNHESMRKLIGERGSMFSGGQRQRIAIARALYHRPQVILFDEATSALDDGSEMAVIDTVCSLKGDMTLIMIAHRLTTLQRCDKIFVLKNGAIVNEGSPESILPQYRNDLLQGWN
jgi:ABC-type multidrug transport system fused ATPase/permease subunit